MFIAKPVIGLVIDLAIGLVAFDLHQVLAQHVVVAVMPGQRRHAESGKFARAALVNAIGQVSILPELLFEQRLVEPVQRAHVIGGEIHDRQPVCTRAHNFLSILRILRPGRRR